MPPWRSKNNITIQGAEKALSMLDAREVRLQSLLKACEYKAALKAPRVQFRCLFQSHHKMGYLETPDYLLSCF